MSNLILYKPGDKLEKYKPGQSISPWNRSWSLLFFRSEYLDFGAASSALTSRIKNHLRNNNFSHIGDIVSRELSEVAQNDDQSTSLGAKSKNPLKRAITDIGLAFGLRIYGGWEEAICEMSDKLPIFTYSSLPSKPNPLAHYLSSVLNP